MTEKQYAPTKTEKKMTAKVETPVENVPKPKEKVEEKLEEKKEISQEKKEKKKPEKKAPQKKIKKDKVVVNAKSVPISTKYAVGICKFVKNKKIGDAIRDLEEVVLLKKPVPMKGEYAHQKGKGISGAKFPTRAAKAFVVLLKSLAGNANNHEINEPIISEAIANKAQRPFGRFGRVKRKRTHIKLVARELKVKETKKKGEEKK